MTKIIRYNFINKIILDKNNDEDPVSQLAELHL